MKHPSMIWQSVLALVTLAAVASPDLQSAPLATTAQPKIVLDVPMTDQLAPLVAFVGDGREFMDGIVGARLQLADDLTFIISGGKLAPIPGRWGGVQTDTQVLISLWAKTGQIDFNGNLIELPNNGLAISYFVQVNAPRTDGSAAPAAGPLKPASLQILQVLIAPNQTRR